MFNYRRSARRTSTRRTTASATWRAKDAGPLIGDGGLPRPTTRGPLRLESPADPEQGEAVGLRSARTFGPYGLAPLGAGGMGEVYRAPDTQLDRDVAIKLLPEAFAADPERLARFEREAKVLASLNHPNIATIYGLEEVGQPASSCMELVEGETSPSA